MEPADDEPGSGPATAVGDDADVEATDTPDVEADEQRPQPLLGIDSEDHPGRDLADLITWGIVAACCVAVFVSLHPEWIVRTTTPTGGDMGAHVWGPAFLRDELLPSFRLAGWAPDWYAGFPAFTFYMVVPMLAIVVLEAGPPIWATPFLLAALAAVAVVVRRRVTNEVARHAIWVLLVLAAVLCVPIPYEVAFKVVAVSGLVAMPACAYALARGARLAFPGPALLAVGAAAFLYETGYSILGGNILSTMAGEFAFAISLALALCYLGVLHRGIRTRTYRALGAVLFGLVILCHLIPAIFAVIATVVLSFTAREDRTPWWDRDNTRRWIAAGIVTVVALTLWLRQPWFPIVGTIAALVLFIRIDGRVWRWAGVVGPVGFLVACFWFVPFYLNSTYLNDMGWEKYTQYASYLWPQPANFDMPYRNVVFTLAALGVLLSIVHRVRLGWWLTLVVVALAWMFRFMPQYRLWNARILPFYYLALYLLAALAVALVIRSLALVVGDLMRRREEPVWVAATGAVAVLVVVAVAIGGALRGLPGGQLVTDEASGATVYRWLGIDFDRVNNASGWALYNFQGLEQREAYPEFREVIDTMERVGDRRGCGRAMWEYEKELERFGTPMALMLLPYFTDGCIGSMEGLYFEASSTTPFHFLNQSELSIAPSRAQRDLPYGPFDIDLGVSHLQMLGVRYYMTSSTQATEAAAGDPRLTRVATIGPFDNVAGGTRTWTVWEVEDSELVAPLRHEPVVLTDADDHIDGWVYGTEREDPAPGQVMGSKTPGPAVEWYLDPERWDVPIATSGPPDWPRVRSTDTDVPRRRTKPVRVSDISAGTDRISFRVDRTGSPVVVRASYFPNWRVEGADGPYRISPNLMAVVPTENEVTLTYGRSAIDLLGWLMTIVGVAGVVVLAVLDERRRKLAGEVGGEPGDGSSGADSPVEGPTGESPTETGSTNEPAVDGELGSEAPAPER